MNTAMSANNAMPMFLTSCEIEMHIWKYGWEWIALCKSALYLETNMQVWYQKAVHVRIVKIFILMF